MCHRRLPAAEDDPGTPKLQGIHTYEITFSNHSRAVEVIDPAVANGAVRAEDVRFILSEERRRQALGDAVDDARGQAEALAARANLTFAEVDTVTTTQTSPVRNVETAANAADGSGASTSVASGPLTGPTHVRGTFNATAS